MTEQPEQLMSRGREISMTTTEKAAMRHKLLAYTLSYHSRVIAAAVVWSWVRRHAAASSLLAAVLVLGGTGVSAHMAGPNDALYNFRLQVNDRIEAVMASGEDAQFDVELRQIERQMDAEEGAFDETLADEEQEEQDEDLNDDEKTEDLNRKDQKESDDDGDNDEDNNDDDLEEELRKLDRELQQEESANIELEN